MIRIIGYFLARILLRKCIRKRVMDIKKRWVQGYSDANMHNQRWLVEIIEEIQNNKTCT